MTIFLLSLLGLSAQACNIIYFSLPLPCPLSCPFISYPRYFTNVQGKANAPSLYSHYRVTVVQCELELAAKGFWGSKSGPVSVGTARQDWPEHS